ncbi:MAG TPA: GntR family transcriptional regulator [Anaerolineales bacterium]|nr:GntR family transcriptional regulator [Anaerolineales bacterium]
MNLENTAKHRIYRTLRREVILGALRAGDRFDVEALAQRFETSVTPVRDALQMLSQEGLVTIRPRSGYFVRQVTLGELRDMLELRRILELAAIERAVLRISEAQIAELRRVHAGYSGDDDLAYERYTDENRRFHVLLAEGSGNAELAVTLGRLLDRLARFMVMRQAGRFMEDSHTQILNALAARDIVAARQAMESEIDSSHDAILDRVMREQAASWPVGAVKSE